MVEENKLKDVILEKLVDFVYDRIGIDNVNSVIDLEKFWEEFYSDCYMDNPPWEATSIINGIWEDINITNIELFEALIEEKKKARDYMSSDSDDDVETVESIILECENEESDELSMEKIIEPVYDV